MRVVAADPGGTTGLAYCDTRALHEVESAGYPYYLESTELSSREAIFEWLTQHKPEIIVCERFEDRQKAKKTVSLEAIGAIELYAEIEDIPVQLQSASYGKGFFKDDKLKALGLYTKGKPHANDAKRHLLQFLTFVDGEKFWLHRLDSALRPS